MRLKSVGFGLAAVALSAAGAVPSVATSAVAASRLVIGVDHVDLANQQPQNGRVLEYTDFFSRSVSVHTGEIVDFQTAPGTAHAVGVARDEEVARRQFPLVSLDADDPNAKGSGDPKLAVGPSTSFIVHGTPGQGQAPSPCGLNGEPVCTFNGGGDVDSQGIVFGADAQGNPAPADWSIQINAAPGDYDFLCFLHPGMQGKLHVVDKDDPVTSQAANDARGQTQFQADQAAGLAAEAAANVVRFRGGMPGTRTYQVDVSVASGDLHATMLEMLPQHLDLKAGDKVEYHWVAPNEAHTIGFPDNGALPPPIGFDCGNSFQDPAAGPPCMENGEPPEAIFDPGLSASGTVLQSPKTLVDSGVLAGRGYHVDPSIQRWSVATDHSTATGPYSYHCTIHDFMVGTLNVSK